MTTTYTHENGQDMVVEADGLYATYTKGTSEPLYRGTDRAAAAASLEWDEETFTRVVMSDADA